MNRTKSIEFSQCVEMAGYAEIGQTKPVIFVLMPSTTNIHCIGQQYMMCKSGKQIVIITDIRYSGDVRYIYSIH